LSAIAVDDDLAIMVQVAITIVPSLDNNGFTTISIPVLTLTDHFTIAITIAMTTADGDANTTRTDTDADIFSPRRHRNGNSSHRNGGHHKALDHRMLLSMNLLQRQFTAL
jgi:hypothetical protein